MEFAPPLVLRLHILTRIDEVPFLRLAMLESTLSADKQN